MIIIMRWHLKNALERIIRLQIRLLEHNIVMSKHVNIQTLSENFIISYIKSVNRISSAG